MSLDFKRTVSQLLVGAVLASSVAVFAQDKEDKKETKRRKEQQQAGRAERLNSVYKKWMDEDVAYIITDEEKKTFKSLKKNPRL